MHFNGLCMVPNHSWNATMEYEHWVRYTTFTSLYRGKRVLDCASGEGYGTNYIAKYADISFGVDIAREQIVHSNKTYLKTPNPRLSFTQQDATKRMQFNKQSFDLIISFETFEHVEEPAKLLNEFKRLLTKDGKLVLSTPKPTLDLNSGKPVNPHHFNEYNLDELIAFIKGEFSAFLVLGQLASFPYTIHRNYSESLDRYIIIVAGESPETLDEELSNITDLDTAALYGSLCQRYFSSLRFKPRPPRVIFVPLNIDDYRLNPSDRRRIYLVEKKFREAGFETALMPKEDAVRCKADLIFSQNRDFEFWLGQIPLLNASGIRFAFTSSDLLFPAKRSMCHFESALTKHGETAIYSAREIEIARTFFKMVDRIYMGSEYQAAHIIKNFELSPSAVSWYYDCVDTEYYTRQNQQRSISNTNEVTLYWEGYVDNVPYLLEVADDLSLLSQNYKVTLIARSSKNRRSTFFNTIDNKILVDKIVSKNVNVEFHAFELSDAALLMSRSQIGLAPYFTSGCDFSFAKPPNKAILYNYMGLPVLGSPTHAHCNYISNEINGFVIHRKGCWASAIDQIMSNQALFRSMEQKGRELADPYTPRRVAERLIIDLFQTTLTRFNWIRDSDL
jgi:SAM-dependent methyltransferase